MTIPLKKPKQIIEPKTLEKSNYFDANFSYTSFVVKLLRNKLRLNTLVNDSPTRRILDIGSGTGTFIIQLMQNIPSTDAILIDLYIPEKNLYPTLTLNTHLHFLRVRAESFINVQHPDYAWRDRKWWQRGYHQVL